MKITITKNGSLIIDGEYNTIITAKSSNDGICFKVDGDTVHPFTDFIRIEDLRDITTKNHAMYNFIMQNERTKPAPIQR